MAIKDMYLTISEAAEEIGVSRQTMYRWITDNKFPSEKIGGVTLVDRKSVTEYRAAQLDDSFTSLIALSMYKFIRRNFNYEEEDKIEVGEGEDEDLYLVYIVTKKDGKRDKIRIGGFEVTYSVGIKEKGKIKNIKFKDASVIEYTEEDNSKK